MDTQEAMALLRLQTLTTEALLTQAFRTCVKRYYPTDGSTPMDVAACMAVKQAHVHLRAVLRGEVDVEKPEIAVPPVPVFLTLMELFAGTRVSVPVGACRFCKEGWQSVGHDTSCAACDGTGQARVKHGVVTSWKDCTACQSTGRLSRVACDACSGTGRSSDGEGETAFLVPAWAVDGEVVRVRLEAGGAVEMVLHLSMPEGVQRKGGDLASKVYVPFDVMCLGGVIEATSPLGEVASIVVPQGSSEGTTVAAEGMGMPIRSGGRGRTFFRLSVQVPTTFTAAARDWLVRWGDMEAQGWQ